MYFYTLCTSELTKKFARCKGYVVFVLKIVLWRSGPERPQSNGCEIHGSVTTTTSGEMRGGQGTCTCKRKGEMRGLEAMGRT